MARLVRYASSVATLLPGRRDHTGTPAGVGPIAAGDAIRLELSGLGLDLTVQVAADATVASVTAGHGRGPVPAQHQRDRLERDYFLVVFGPGWSASAIAVSWSRNGPTRSPSWAWCRNGLSGFTV